MKKYDFNQLKGFTLLELMLVLIVVAGIIMLGFNQYRQYKTVRDMDAIKDNVALLYNALNIYYRENCTTGAAFTVSTADLTTAKLMPNLTSTGLAPVANYGVSAQLVGSTAVTKKPIYQLITSVTLDANPSQAETYVGLLGATTTGLAITGVMDIPQFQLIWKKLPGYIIPRMQSGLWVANSGLHFFKEQSSLANDTSCAY